MGKKCPSTRKATLGQTSCHEGFSHAPCANVSCFTCKISFENISAITHIRRLSPFDSVSFEVSFSHFLGTMGIPLEGHGFHTFRRSAATTAYDANASLTAIKTHSLWHSDAIWSYISDNTTQALQVPLTFQCLVNNLL